MLLPYLEKGKIEAGVDEAGRGCYAGPVFAAAVILPDGFEDLRLNDSKQVKEADRSDLRQKIEAEALAWAVGMVDVEKIDRINILQASFLAMHLALDQLQVRPDSLLIDGNRFNAYPQIPHHCLIQGDGRFQSIAAASILAKTHRDAHMKMLHESFPHYGWNQNKGYGTAQHRQAIEQHGLCIHHRRSFRIQPTLF